jgi:hypothetical protein
MSDDKQINYDGLATLRKDFESHQISKLPKPTKSQTDAVKADFKAGIRCSICGGWHHKDVVHLDYVGHAALTDRLLNADPLWSWDPVAFGADGLPATDKNGGLWIRLTVCGRSMLGYGHSDGKAGGDAIKEAIGDAMRNAAMRMGAALDLWHKGDLHKDEDQQTDSVPTQKKSVTAAKVNPVSDDQIIALQDAMAEKGMTNADFFKMAKVDSFQCLDKSRFDGALAAINKKAKV